MTLERGFISVVLGSRRATPDPKGTDVEEDFDDQGLLNENIVDALRKTISEFLRMNVELLPIGASLVGLGLDSLDSAALFVRKASSSFLSKS